MPGKDIIMATSPPSQSPAPRSYEQRVIDALYRVANFMGQVTDLHRLLTLIMEETKAVMDSEASSCILYDEEQEELYFEVALGDKADKVKQVRIKRSDRSFVTACLDERRCLIVNDVKMDKRHFTKADETSSFITRNLIASPMIHQDRIIGVLEVLNRREGLPYDEQDGRIMDILADQAAIAIVNARLFERGIQRERLAAVGTAVSGVAHHLKNIIQTIKGSVGLVRMSVEMNRPSIISDCLPVLMRGTDRMEQSVKEMLAYSKGREPEYEACNMGDLLREIIEESRALAEQRGVELRCDLADALPDSFLDRQRLHDALLNLVGNAIEAHGNHPEGAWVEARARRSRDGSLFQITVVDNGSGIPEEIRKKIFQPFFSTKGSKGTGLGLAIAQKVAEENGGSLTLESEMGKGTQFTFRIPVVLSLDAVAKPEGPADADAAPADPAPDAAHGAAHNAQPLEGNQ